MTADLHGEYELMRSKNSKLAMKFSKLCDFLDDYKSAIIAFSGGVDSSLISFLCSKLLDEHSCITADAPIFPDGELKDAIAFARCYHLNHRIIKHDVLNDPRFSMNDTNRCFYCKNGFFGELNEIKAKESYEVIFDGSNYDDLKDYRPGRKAAEKNGVKSPFIEVKLGKEEIRKISKLLGLHIWKKPKTTCLASRIPYGIEIEEELLKRIDRAEEILKSMGYQNVRVRFHGDVARIEIGRNEIVDLEKLRGVVPKIKNQGFKYATLDLEGYRTGSLNE